MAIMTIDTVEDLKRGVDYVCASEPMFARLVEKTGLPPMRRRPPGIKGLLEIITGQQISVHAAAAIWQRVEEKFATFDVADLEAASDKDFIDCGLSRPKIVTIRAILTEIKARRFDIDGLSGMSSKQVIKSLTSIKGLGPWSAQIYMLSNLGRSDVWPVGDLALQESAKMLFSLNERPGQREMAAMGKRWQPWRAVAARLLWSHYRYVKFDGGEI